MIDLNTANPGDTLISSQGAELEYIAKTPWNGHTYADHVVKYIKVRGDDGLLKPARLESYGTRTNDGFMFIHYRDPGHDNDIVKIIPKGTSTIDLKEWRATYNYIQSIESETRQLMSMWDNRTVSNMVDIKIKLNNIKSLTQTVRNSLEDE